MSSADISIFLPEISNVISKKNTDIDYIVSNSFNFFEVILINMAAIIIMLAKLVTLGPLKIKVFWNKGYDVMTSPAKFYLVTQIIL